MKKALAVLVAIGLLALGGAAFAHMWGDGEGGHMRGPGYMRGMDQKLLDETADLRKEIHAKRFELGEAARKGEQEKAEAIEKDLDKLEDKLYEKVGPRKAARMYGCGGPGSGPGGGGCSGPCGGRN